MAEYKAKTTVFKATHRGQKNRILRDPIHNNKRHGLFCPRTQSEKSGLMCFINKWLLYSWKWPKTQWHSRSLAFVSKRRWGLTGFWAMRALWYMSFWRGCSSLKIYHLRPFFLRMWISTQKIWFDRVRRLCLETLINSPSPRDSRFTWPNCSAADPNKPSNKMKVQQISST